MRWFVRRTMMAFNYVDLHRIASRHYDSTDSGGKQVTSRGVDLMSRHHAATIAKLQVVNR